MVVTFGIEAISVFDLHNSNREEKYRVDNLSWVKTICDDLDEGLRKYKHTRKFYLGETDCGETDIRDITFKGVDNYYADNVDLFYICTHGGNDEGIISLTYNSKAGEWWADSRFWRLGDKKLKWLFMRACSTLNLTWDFSLILKLLPIFQNLHLICGAYGTMVGSHTTDENGEDLADNLAKYNKPVADSWIDAEDDWLWDNHPMVVAAENRESIDVITGRPNWNLSTMARDHLTGPVPNIPNSNIYWLSMKWREGSDVKQRRAPVK